MPSVKSSVDVLKYTSEQLHCRTSISNRNGFSTLAIPSDEQITPSQRPGKGEDKLSIPNCIVRSVAPVIPGHASSTEEEGEWIPIRATRRCNTRKTTNANKNRVNSYTERPGTVAASTTWIGTNIRRGKPFSFNKSTRVRASQSNVAFAKQYPGACVWHSDYRPVLKGTITVSDSDKRYLTTAPDGSVWMKKPRYWIVIARTKFGVTEVPIYTYHDHGLQNKPEAVKPEYLSLKPLQLSGNSSFVNQISGHPVLEFSTMDRPNEELKATMVIHYTEITTRDIEIEDLRYVGNISDTANKTLQEFVKSHIGAQGLLACTSSSKTGTEPQHVAKGARYALRSG